MTQTIDDSARRQEKLGRRLAAEKKKCRASGRTWKSYVKDCCGLSRERADELIRIGMGSLSIEESRATKKRRQRKTRLLRRTTSSGQMIDLHVHRSRSICDKISEGLDLRRFSKKEIAQLRVAAQEAVGVWQDLLQTLGD